jgi:hypothetical protein
MNGMPNATRGLEPISYRGALLSTLLHATVYVFTQFAECTGTDCKQNGITDNMNGGIRFQCQTAHRQSCTVFRGNHGLVRPGSKVKISICTCRCDSGPQSGGPSCAHSRDTRRWRLIWGAAAISASAATPVFPVPHRRRGGAARNEATLWRNGEAPSTVPRAILRRQLLPTFLFVPCHPLSTLALCVHGAITRTGSRCTIEGKGLRRGRRPSVTKNEMSTFRT